MSHRIWTDDDNPIYASFFAAVASGDAGNLNSTLVASVDVNALQGDGMEGQTALHAACAAGNTQIVALLLTNGADPNIYTADPYGECSPLHMSASRGYLAITKLLLDYGADPAALDGEGCTALETVFQHTPAIPSAYIDVYQLLLERGRQDESKRPVLSKKLVHQAASMRDTTLIRLLLDNGLDIKSIDLNDTGSILCSSALSGSLEMLKLLMNHGAQVKSDALELASRRNEKEVLQFLLSHTDDSAKASDAFHIACSSGDTHLDIVKMFLDKSWDENSSDSKGEFPLLLACGSSNKSAKVVSLLLSAGADVSVQSTKFHSSFVTDGDTPLHRTAWRSDPDAVKTLLAAGVNLTTVNKKGETPLIKMAYNINRQSFDLSTDPGSNSRLIVLELLLTHGSMLDTKDLRGRTAAHALLSNNCAEITPGIEVDALRLLLHAGADVVSLDGDGKSLVQVANEGRKRAIMKFLDRYQSSRG